MGILAVSDILFYGMGFLPTFIAREFVPFVAKFFHYVEKYFY
jgi:hypothetical protein